jgi:hypothetical protein
MDSGLAAKEHKERKKELKKSRLFFSTSLFSLRSFVAIESIIPSLTHTCVAG